MMGTIGDNERIDSTVISKVVNLASRLESLTRVYNASIITTVQVIMDMPLDMNVAYRQLSFETIRGIDTPISIFEIYESDTDEVKDYKNKTKARFEDAIILFRQFNLDEAYNEF